MNRLKYILIFLAVTFCPFSISAQKDLKINEIFENIGKKKGTLVQLGPDVLSSNTNIILYKSLLIKDNGEILETVEEALIKDTKGANSQVISSNKKEGVNKSVRYALAQKENIPFHEYILFNYSEGYINLVYIKGNFPTSELQKELNKLKKLFIELK